MLNWRLGTLKDLHWVGVGFTKTVLRYKCECNLRLYGHLMKIIVLNVVSLSRYQELRSSIYVETSTCNV